MYVRVCLCVCVYQARQIQGPMSTVPQSRDRARDRQWIRAWGDALEPRLSWIEAEEEEEEEQEQEGKKSSSYSSSSSDSFIFNDTWIEVD
jgi:hypothetical protein